MKNQSAGQIKSSGRRAAAYWFMDGLPEIAFGLLLLIPGISGIVMGIVKESHRQNAWNTALFLIVVTTFWILFFVLWCKNRQVLDFFKARLTYPRTGYARPPDNPAPGMDVLMDLWAPDKRRFELVTLGTAHPPDENVTSFLARTVFTFFAAFLIAQVLVGVSKSRWSIAILMVVVAIAIFALNRREARSYSLWSVSTIALAGILSAVIKFPSEARMMIPMVIGGGWLSAQGGWTLIRYLRSHPRSKAPEHTRL